MSTFSYKLEYNKPNGYSDDSVYLHSTTDPYPYYRSRIGKENYDKLDSSLQDALANALFNVAGITEISVMAYRIWYMKSPIYDWVDINTAVIALMKDLAGAAVVKEIAGSASIDGRGIRLDTDIDRRPVKIDS